ncbi:flagellar brake protein [Clostridium thermarum]|uniref:flagellar brake protein n=1 Tax=Clostridium thermarum TaxID=1716543 RepID=UPI0013D33DA4|nr:PilZ domain-containing protein [Clostridium thermarum]
MSIKLIVNSRIEVLNDTEVYKSTIQDENSNNFSISLPVKNGVYMTPVVGQMLEMLYYDNLNVYKFEALVLGRKTENAVPQLLLSLPQNVVRVQRRKFVRVSTISYIKYSKYSNEELNKISLEDNIQFTNKGILLDISGGGCRLSTGQRLQLKDIIVTDIPTDKGTIRVMGEVVRVEKQPDDNYYCGINFTIIDERTRDRIIQYIFALMRKQRKNL